MVTNHISTNQTSTYNLDNSNETWILDAGVSITTSSGHGLHQSSNFHHDAIEINGTITQTALDYSALAVRGSQTDVLIGKTGVVTGYVGVSFYDTEQDSLINHGSISATGPVPTGVSIGSSVDFEMRSDGEISGCIYVFSSDDVTIRLGKDSLVDMNGPAAALNIVNEAGATTKVINARVVEGNEGYSAFGGRDGNETLVNTGKMTGSFAFDAGDDLFDTRKGKFDGNVYMGEGNDTMLMSKSSAYIYEYAGEGTDTLKANCSYTLVANSEIEILQLIGNKNFKAFGNNLDNQITGNIGNNTLSGFEGTDFLTGAKGADTFVFATGHGTDIITDFGLGNDTIDLSDLAGVKNFKDLMANHVSKDGDDLVIASGADSLTLLDVSKSELQKPDFLF